MTRATRWTHTKVEALRLPEDKQQLRVRIEPCLYLMLRRRSNGLTTKRWLYRAQVDGQRRSLALGEFPAVGLAEASENGRAVERNRAPAKNGLRDHPVVAARLQRKARKAIPTVRGLFEEWIADKQLGSARKGGAPVRRRTIDLLRYSFDRDIAPRIGDVKLVEINRTALQACIDAPRNRRAPGAAAHVYRTLRGLIRFGLSRGFLATDPMLGIGNPRPYRPATVVALDDNGIAALLRALDTSELWMSTRLAVEFQLLTGARPGEVRLATWAEIDLQRGMWTIPEHRFKSGRDHRVHLSRQALRLLEQAGRLPASPGGWVFPGANGGPMEKTAVGRALSRTAVRATDPACVRVRPHDLRRTFRTMLSRIGVAPHIGELCLSHQERETMRRVYDGYSYWREQIEAWDRAGQHIESLRSDGARVVSIFGHAAGESEPPYATPRAA